MKKYLSLLLIATTLISSNMCILADDNTVTITSDSIQEVPVTADIASTFTVTIPKTITITDNTSPAEFTVSADGDIGGAEALIIAADMEVIMSSNGKNDVTLNVAQMFYASNSRLPISCKGKIFTDGLTAGNWYGTLNFDIQYGILSKEIMSPHYLDISYMTNNDTWSKHSSVKHIVFSTNALDNVCRAHTQMLVESNSYEEYISLGESEEIQTEMHTELFVSSGRKVNGDYEGGVLYGYFDESINTLYMYTMVDAPIVFYNLDGTIYTKEEWMQEMKTIGSANGVLFPNLESVECR